jgi:CheY-like chemotaxis protein
MVSAESSPVDEEDVVVHEGGSVLVMDDDEMVRELATLSLGRQGYTVMTCCNGKEAINLYKAAIEAGAPFSVVLMDLTIPGSMGGVETARQILAFDPAAPLVVSSGYSADPVMANYKEYGFCAAIEKPYNVEDIARIISCNRR